MQALIEVIEGDTSGEQGHAPSTKAVGRVFHFQDKASQFEPSVASYLPALPFKDGGLNCVCRRSKEEDAVRKPWVGPRAAITDGSSMNVRSVAHHSTRSAMA